MLRNFLLIGGLLGAGILIGYIFVPDSGVERTAMEKGEDPAPPPFNPSAARAIDAESLSALQNEMQQARQAH